MIRIVAGLSYCAIYIGAVSFASGDVARRWIGDLAELVRERWRGAGR